MSLALLGALVCTGVAAAQENAQEAPSGVSTTVVEVRVVGNDRLSKNAILSYCKTRVGMPYEESVVKGDRDRLMTSGRFSNVIATRLPTDKGVIVTFRVVERPTVTRVEFAGLKRYKEVEIRKELPFGEGDPLNQASVQAGKQAIINKYKGDGFHFVDVTVDEEVLAKDHAVVYRIVEGPRTIVKKVRYEGAHYFNRLTLVMRTETKAKFWPFLSGALNSEKLQRDVTMLRNIYVDEGFLDVEVGRRLDFSDDKKTVVVAFLIKEGPRFRINQVTFRGNTVFSSPELANRLKLQQGAFFTTEGLRIDLKRLEDTYGELGYIEAEVKVRKRFLNGGAPPPDWARDLDGGKPALLDLVFDLTENDQYRIGSIRVQGNTITQERVIRREFRFRPEQLYDIVAVEMTKRELEEMRLFEEVTISPVPTKNKGVKDILVDVKEGRTAEFLIGVGISSSSGLLGTVSFTQRNFDILAWPGSFKHFIKAQTFKGAGQTFSLSAEPGTEIMRFSVNWFSPYIFDQPYSVGMKGYVFKRDYDDSYDETRVGALGSLGHMFKNRWYGELATRLEYIDMTADSVAPVEIEEDKGGHTLLGFRGSLVRDRTDSRWNPTKGDRFSFSYEQVVGTDVFGRFNTQYKYYYTLYTDALDRKHILATRASYGQIVGDAPVFEKFYGGGLGSVRGFKYRGISPRGHWADGSMSDEPIGGDMSLFIGTEYTFPLIADQLRGVLFVDSGTVEENFSIETYRVAAGFGFRWVIPFFGPVPMDFDFGFPISKAKEDDTQIFSFSLGWTF